ncbi:hypothetical protein ABIB06_006584 [Bradyrhizobium sp. LB8.2]|uniref:hypothetical protein n=1 Tax=unclassified Bradyrhizobium TaxID=2631580 RepID=UPI00339B2C91
MAFEFDLQVDPDPPANDAWGVEFVEFALGYDVDAEIVILMSVMLVPDDELEAYDLRFGIREQHLQHNWNVSPPDYTKETVDRYIPKQWRTFVGIKLRQAVRQLVEKVGPQNITMETFYAGLEQKALTKYDLISASVHICGYETSERFRDETTQKDHWLFTKQV